jgi:hypothetical protein
MMRKVLLSMAATAAALVAAPSMAQSYGYSQPGYGDRGGYTNNGGPDRGGLPSPWDVRQMVERSIQRGELSRGEARHLRDEVDDLMRLDRRARYGNDWGRQRAVERKTRDILNDLRDARRDGNGYGRPGYPRGSYDRPGY